MLHRLRSLGPALMAGALVLALAAPASAGRIEQIDKNSVPPIVDLAVLRPLGLAATAAGVAAFLPAAALTALFRPSDVMKPFDVLVKGPFTYTFVDPLGTHGSN